MIEVKNLKISFGNLHVIKDVSIKIEKGEKIVKKRYKNVKKPNSSFLEANAI